MDQTEFSDAALVLLGHGSTLEPDAGAAVVHQAAELRRRGQFAVVQEAFWKQEPQAKDVLSRLTVPRIFIVPLFISEGYFSDSVIPRELGFGPGSTPSAQLGCLPAGPGGSRSRVQWRGRRKLVYCQAVGSHARLADVVAMRAREVVEKFPFPRPPAASETTLFVAGHGTEQNERSREAIERQAARIRERGVYASVQAVFLEEPPRIDQCYALAPTRNAVVVPFFMSDGMHVKADIPVLLGEPRRLVQQRLERGRAAWRNPTERRGKLVWYSASVGSAPQVADVILARAQEAVSWPEFSLASA